MIKLSKRLKKVIEMIDAKKIVADVGTDHGLLPMYLIENGITKNAIASDVIPSICENTQKKICQKGFENQIKVICSDGLQKLTKEKIDQIVIAGMGGLLICDILKASKKFVQDKVLILSPHRDSYELRKYLHKIGFKIIKEDIIEDGKDKFYPIIKAKFGLDAKYTETDYMLGRYMIKHKNDEFIKYINYRLNKINQMIEKVKKGSNPSEKLRELEQLKKMYKKIIGE